jgi:hypothetical protein
MKLQQLHAAEDLKDLLIPVSNQLEALKGDRKGDRFHREGKEPWLNDPGLIVRARPPHGSRTPWTY